MPTEAAPRGRFSYPRTAEVRYGSGALDELIGLADEFRASRVFVIGSRSLLAGGLAKRLADLLGSRLVGVHTGVAQHVPRPAVIAAAQAARDVNAEMVVSLGGGTPIDCAKGVLLCLAAGISTAKQFDDFHIRFEYPDLLEAPPLPEDVLPHVSIPTTLSGSEHTNLFGITDPHRRVKHLYTGPAYAPAAVLLDADLTVATPDDLWVSSGIRAVDHAVEATLSARHLPFVDGLSREGLGLLRKRLMASVVGSDKIEARLDCMLGAWAAAYGLTNVGTGLSHAIGHQLAVEFDLMHGVTSAIMLPHVLEFNASVNGGRLRRLAQPLEVEVAELDDAAAAARVISSLAEFIAGVERFGVPHSLSAAGASRSGLGKVAQRVLHDMGAAQNPRPLTHSDVVALLEAAW